MKLNIPLQFIGLAVSFVSAMVWMPLLFMVLHYLDVAVAGGIHWAAWVLFWAMAFLKALSWTLYSALDVDGDGMEGG